MPFRRLCLLSAVALVLCLGLYAPQSAHADTFMQLFSPRIGHLETKVNLRGFWQPTVDATTQDAEFSLIRTKLDVITPLAQNERYESAMFFNVSHTRVDTQAILPDTGRAFPSDLWKLGAGAFYRRKINDTWIVSAMAQIGSNSDKPFNSGDEANISGFVIARMAMGGGHAWNFMLAYSKNSDFLAGLPTPGVAWSYRPNRELMVLLGAPMCALVMRPNPQSTLSLFWLFPHTVRARAAIRPAKPWEVFVAFHWIYDDYYLADRPNNDFQLLMYEKKAMLGLSYDFSKKVSLTATASWVFDRIIFQGEDFRDTDKDHIKLDDGPELAMMLRFSL